MVYWLYAYCHIFSEKEMAFTHRMHDFTITILKTNEVGLGIRPNSIQRQILSN